MFARLVWGENGVPFASFYLAFCGLSVIELERKVRCGKDLVQCEIGTTCCHFSGLMVNDSSISPYDVLKICTGKECSALEVRLPGIFASIFKLTYMYLRTNMDTPRKTGWLMGMNPSGGSIQYRPSFGRGRHRRWIFVHHHVLRVANGPSI